MDAGDGIQPLIFIGAAVHPFGSACPFQSQVYMFLPGFAVCQDGLPGVPVSGFLILPAGCAAWVFGCPDKVSLKSLRRGQPDFLFAFVILVLFLPAFFLCGLKFFGCESLCLVSFLTEIFLLRFRHPPAVFIQRPEGQEDVCMGIAENHIFPVSDPVPVCIYGDAGGIPDRRVVETDIGNHAV